MTDTSGLDEQQKAFNSLIKACVYASLLFCLMGCEWQKPKYENGLKIMDSSRWGHSKDFQRDYYLKSGFLCGTVQHQSSDADALWWAVRWNAANPNDQYFFDRKDAISYVEEYCNAIKTR